jgi:hypothetical protein
MDTPACPPPKNAQEQNILEKLSLIRNKLLLLKQDRTTYIRSQDVLPLYDETIEQVRELNDLRSSEDNEENRGTYITISRQLSDFLVLTVMVVKLTASSRAASSFCLYSS